MKKNLVLLQGGFKTFCLVALTLFVANSVKAQIAPVHSEEIMPTFMGGASQVHSPIKTSAYSYPNVSFFGGAGVIDQDLYVYSWNGGNFVGAGIAWKRKAPMTDFIIDEGFIPVPIEKTNMELGLIKDDAGEVWVIAAYIHDTDGAKYDVYRWHPGGLYATPNFTVPIRYERSHLGSESHSIGYTMSMDCHELNRIVFVWDEKQKFNIDEEELNPGGIMVHAINNNAPVPFTATSSGTRLVEESANNSILPDVAFGMGGEKVRIAYFTQNIVTANLEVRNTDYNDIYLPTTPLFPIANFLSLDHSQIKIANLPYFSNLKIDAPDKTVSPMDIWTVVFNDTVENVRLITKPPTGGINDTVLYTTMPGNNCNPVVAYSPNGESINVGWFNDTRMRYSATRMNNDGLAYVAPATPLVYYDINFSATGGYCETGGKMAFCTQQDEVGDLGMFIAYPTFPTFTFYGDMRTKVIKWNTPFFYREDRDTTTAMESISPELGSLHIYPNPFSTQLSLDFPTHTEKPVSLKIYNVQGSKVAELNAASIKDFNATIHKTIHPLQSGLYYFNVKSEQVEKTIPLTKL